MSNWLILENENVLRYFWKITTLETELTSPVPLTGSSTGHASTAGTIPKVVTQAQTSIHL
jgi:hypothetical protein